MTLMSHSCVMFSTRSMVNYTVHNFVCDIYKVGLWWLICKVEKYQIPMSYTWNQYKSITFQLKKHKKLHFYQFSTYSIVNYKKAWIVTIFLRAHKIQHMLKILLKIKWLTASDLILHIQLIIHFISSDEIQYQIDNLMM